MRWPWGAFEKFKAELYKTEYQGSVDLLLVFFINGGVDCPRSDHMYSASRLVSRASVTVPTVP